MTSQNRGPHEGRMAPVQPTRRAQATQRAETTQRTTPRQALWSCAVAAAVVFILAVVFYGINATEHPQTASLPAPATTSASTGAQVPAQTTGQGGTQSADKPAGQSGK